MTFRHPMLREEIPVTKGGLFIAAGAVAFAGAAIIGVMVALVIGISDAQKQVQRVARDNQVAINELQAQNKRIKRIETPTPEQRAADALRAIQAIRSCARSARCRRQNPSVAAVGRLIPRGEIPRRAPRRRRSTNGSSGGGQGNGNGGTLTNPPSSPAPTQTGRVPQPTTRPAPASPPPSSTPARPPASPSPAPRQPAPPPSTGVTVPPVSVPPTPVTPPVTVPPVPPVSVPLPGICTPVIGVNCPPNR